MKIVGDRLGQWALEQGKIQEKDLFGRSAFNRYYYAAFLLTRKMLSEFKDSWKGTAHKAIPDLLVTTVKKEVANSLKRSFQKGLITEGEKSQIMTKHNSSLFELSNLLKEAYQIRIIADYEPEILIKQENKIILLDNRKLTSAEKWPERTGAFCKAIRKSWKDAGLA